MLDFPNSPSIDQTYQGPSGQLWRWTGNMWSAVRRPVLGVADGSNAAPGEVGEYIINESSAARPTGWSIVDSMDLTAGDWDVNACSYATANTGALWVINLANTPSPANVVTSQQAYVGGSIAGASWNSVALQVGPLRVNRSSSFTVYLWFYCASASTISWSFSARRMR